MLTEMLSLAPHETLTKKLFFGDLPDSPAGTLPTGIVGIDIETEGTSLEPSSGSIGCVTFWWGSSRTCAVLSSLAKDTPNLRKYLSSASVAPIFHNYAFDASWLVHHCGVLPQLYGDTKLVAKLLDEPATSLSALLEKYLVADPADRPDKTVRISPWCSPYSRWTPGMREYVLNDVRHLDGLYVLLHNQLTARQQNLYHRLVRLLPSLVELQQSEVGSPLTNLGDLQFLTDYASRCPSKVLEKLKC